MASTMPINQSAQKRGGDSLSVMIRTSRMILLKSNYVLLLCQR